MILEGNSVNTLPKIVYEEMNGTISISGRSISTDANKYFLIFLNYLDDCLQKKPMNLKIDIDLEYFNTITARELINFFNIVKKVKKEDFEITINWYADYDDEDMFDAGEDFQSLTKLKFNVIEKPEKS